MRDVMSLNGLEGGTYVEPFAGGAGVAINLLLSGFVSKIVLNDVDPSIYWFWKSILDDNEEFIEKIENTELTVSEWDRQHEVQRTKYRQSGFDIGFSTFYLNRTNRSGIIDGGMIGGRGQDGMYKLDARFNKGDLIKRIRAIGDLSDSIDLYCSDASYFLDEHLPREYDVENTLVYADPPYYAKGGLLYLNHYGHGDHVNIASVLRNLRFKWILSYDNVDEIQQIYSWAKPVEFNMYHSANVTHVGRELFYAADNMILPSGEVIPSRSRIIQQCASIASMD
ncbi:Site-specific DNA methylase [Thermoplasmatales archaeon BRNA1]|nr:Site-specific DNA methylase [Thermoplasmatales archaeon BRNA1]